MDHVRTFLSAQAATFALAALIHAGVLAEGFQHRQASIAEGVIAIVLALGLLAGVTAPRWSRTFGLAAQVFALVGTLLGVVMIAIGVGPQSGFDKALHALMLTLLVGGLIVVFRVPGRLERRGA